MNKLYAMPLTALLGGGAAFALRMLQNSTGFEPDTGLPIPGNIAGTALLALLIALAAAILWLARQLPQEEPGAASFPSGFDTDSTGLLAVPLAGIFLMGLSGLADLAECAGVLPPDLSFSRHALYGILRQGGMGFSTKGQLLLGALALAAAAGLFMALSMCRRKPAGASSGAENPDAEASGGEAPQAEHKPPLSDAALGGVLLFPVGALVIRLVLTYRVDSVNPSLAMYCLELLALVFMTLAFYRLSSFAYQAGKTSRFAVYASAASVLCMASLADGGAYLSSALLYAGGWLTLLGFLLLRVRRMEEGTDSQS